MSDKHDEAKAVLEVLATKGIDAKVVSEFSASHIKKLVLDLAPGVRFSKLQAQRTAIAQALGVDATQMRIEAPMFGSVYVSIEYPNRNFEPFVLSPESFMDSIYHKSRVVEWTCKLAVIAGKRADGLIESFDLSSMPHLLVGGSCDKAGVDNFLDATMAGWMSALTPEQVKFILIDSEDHAFGKYADSPYLLVPPIENRSQIAFAFLWLVEEMEKRLKMFMRARVRNIHEFNGERPPVDPDMFGPRKKLDLFEEDDDPPATVPYIVMVINDDARLKGVEEEGIGALAKITARGRAAGLHVVIATRKKSTQVPTDILANIPGRIAFKAASPKESRMLIDDTGAEKLFGSSDCLYRSNDGRLVRLLAPSGV